VRGDKRGRSKRRIGKKKGGGVVERGRDGGRNEVVGGELGGFVMLRMEDGKKVVG